MPTLFPHPYHDYRLPDIEAETEFSARIDFELIVNLNLNIYTHKEITLYI